MGLMHPSSKGQGSENNSMRPPREMSRKCDYSFKKEGMTRGRKVILQHSEQYEIRTSCQPLDSDHVTLCLR